MFQFCCQVPLNLAGQRAWLWGIMKAVCVWGWSPGGNLNLELAVAANSEVVRAKLGAIQQLGLKDHIEDILISLSNEYHLIRLLDKNERLFLYLVLDRAKGNLALARYKLLEIEKSLLV